MVFLSPAGSRLMSKLVGVEMGGTKPDEMVGSVAGNPDRGTSVYFLSIISASLKFKSQQLSLILWSA
jgi:hypothetical protein